MTPGPLEIYVNNGSSLVSGVNNVTATPVALPSTGYFPPTISSANSIGYSQSDASIREGISGASSDERIGFPGSLLQKGQNTIAINMRKGGSLDNHAMYDYIRLELTGYVPPPPANVAAYAGNNCNLISWPVTPGATSYNIFSSRPIPAANTSLIASGVTGPVCGSGYNNATGSTPTPSTARPITTLCSRSIPAAASSNSPESSRRDAFGGHCPPARPPRRPVSTWPAWATKAWLSIGVAAPGANFYTVWRSVLVDTLGGAFDQHLGHHRILNNANAGTSYTDTSPTDGSVYSYFRHRHQCGWHERQFRFGRRPCRCPRRPRRLPVR
jgi:hypothetical protein